MGRLSPVRRAFLRLLNIGMDIQTYQLKLSDILSTNVLELSKIIPSAIASNNGGWQGVITDQKIDWVEDLRKLIEHTTNKTTQRFWFNINGPGHSNNWHQHFSNSYAAVLYIDVPPNSGDIEFRENDNLTKISPKSGMLLVFPGILEHRVLTNLSNKLRISLATNLV
jgi:hypothetical protein